MNSQSNASVTWAGFDDPERQLCLKQMALDLSPLPIGIASPQGEITFANPALARLWGLGAPASMVGLPVSSLWEGGAAAMRRMCHPASPSEWFCEGMGLRSDGSTFPVRFQRSLVRDAAGEVLGVVACFEDLTEWDRLEQDQRQLLADLANLVGNVKILRGLVPICAWCKKIRDDAGQWQQLEAFLHDHTEAHFSHGACPDCAARICEEDESERGV